MASSERTSGDQSRTVAVNRRARFDWFVESTVEAGLVLVGSEVKSARKGQATVHEAYASFEDGELYLVNSYIPEYSGANRFNHEPRRRRKLLLHRREMNKLLGATQRKGYSLVPLSLYFNARGLLKISLGLALGKKDHDRRETIREREWQRQKARTLRGDPA